MWVLMQKLPDMKGISGIDSVSEVMVTLSIIIRIHYQKFQSI